MFSGYSFVFDGIASERFGLFIYAMNGTGSEDIESGNKLSLVTDRARGSVIHDLMTIEEDGVLEFKLVFGSLTPLSRQEIQTVHKWLRKNSYAKLQIVQEDMKHVYYNCVLHSSVVKTVGNMPYAFEYTVTCDSPFAWEEEKVYDYGTVPGRVIRHYNDSDVTTYVKPCVTFTSTVGGNDVVIENTSNNGWTTELTNLGSNEKVMIDSALEIIETDRRSNILDTFNMHWLELVPGLNILHVTGNVYDFKISYANARRIGG